ncbi:MAG: DMT family transporter [Clostridiaceae bacterium]|nr:DMT family transporter [Clostridiaceae bacterium]
MVFGEKTLNHISAVTLSFVQSTLAIIICGIMGFTTRSFSGISMLSISIVLSLFYAGIFCTIGGYMLQNVALKHISAKTVGMIQCLYPVMTAVVAFMMLGEVLSILGLIGAGIITVCVLLESSFNEQKGKNKLIQVENNKNRVLQEFSETQG